MADTPPLPAPPARRPIDSLQLLVEASEIAANHPLDLDDLLRALAGLLRKLVDYQLFAVLLADGSGTLSIRYSIGFRPDLVKNLRVRPGEGITGAAAEKRRTMVVDDVRLDPRYLSAIDAVRSEIAVPLVARGRLVGVIDLQSSTQAAFGENERATLELVGSRFSLAIEAAELYQATLRHNATLTTLAEIAQGFAHILDLNELLHQLSVLVRGLIYYDAFSIYLLEDRSDTFKHYFGVSFDQRVQWQSIPLGHGVVGHAARERGPIRIDDTAKDERYIEAVHGIRSEVAVPLIVKDVVIGVLDLESGSPAAFTSDHVQALTLLAPQVAAAIENARLYEQVARNEERMGRDLLAARQLQRSLLPQGCPDCAGIDVAARSAPATEVSGDFYDFLKFGDSVGIWLGDVSGKGAAAALYAAMASGLLRNLAVAEQTPIELLGVLNARLMERRVDTRFLAAIYALWDPHKRELTLASAGQPRPIIRRNGTVEVLDLGGTPLGLIEKVEFDTVTLNLEPGDLFITASDGLHETMDKSGAEYGDESLQRLVERLDEMPSARILESIFEDSQRHSRRKTPADDRTVIVLRAT